MDAKRDKIVVIDLEATCWKKKPPPGQVSEIIEIGACFLELDSLQPERKQSIMVSPARSEVSYFCTKLTTITPELAASGMDFAAACATLQAQFDTRSYLWASWGGYDRRMFASQSELFGVAYPFSDYHLNIKALFADLRNDGTKVGLMRALKMTALEPVGTHHRGADDAWNAARVLGYLLGEFGRETLEPFWTSQAAIEDRHEN